MYKLTSPHARLLLALCLLAAPHAGAAPQHGLARTETATALSPRNSSTSAAAAPSSPDATLQQQQQQSPQPRTSPTPPRRPVAEEDDGVDDGGEVVRITSNLVQVDAVVTDGDGRQVTDLRAEDFEISEDGAARAITNFSYVSTQPPNARPSAPAAPNAKKSDTSVPPPPPARLRPEEVRRTVALVVDDLGLSFESTASVRAALKKFVDEQMQPSDLVAIVRTSAGVGALQQFTSDKQILRTAIERVKWYPMGQGGASAFSLIEPDPLTRLSNSTGADGRVGSLAGSARATGEVSEEIRSEFREELFSVGTLGALNYVVRGLKELPGRKSVVLFSDGIRLFHRIKSPDRSGGTGNESTSGAAGTGQTRIRGDEAVGYRENTRVVEAMRRLADLANRASVVIYTMDARGLQTLTLQAGDNVADLSTEAIESKLSDRSGEFFETQEGLVYLARTTGGFTVRNSNDLNKGIGRILDDQKGFYLIGYKPDSSTFDPARGRGQFHKINVRVKRPGLKVRTRVGFYGVAEADARQTRRTPEEQLAAALSSPFAAGGVDLRLTALFTNDAKAGSVVRSVLHIDARDLTFAPDADGWQKTVFDLIAFAYGDDGLVVKQVSVRDAVSARGETLQSMLDNGIVYALDVPMKKAGAYQLRVAVRDAGSERVGSATQFVEVPDLDKKRLALSGIYLSGRRLKKGDAAVAGATQKNGARTNGAAASNTIPVAEEETEIDPQAVPAVRRFRQGMMLSYVYVIHNARPDKATGRPRIEAQARLFRDGQLVFAGQIAPVDAEGQTDAARVYAGGRIHLGASLPPGEYTLQVVALDTHAPAKERTATQWMDFEIVK